MFCHELSSSFCRYSHTRFLVAARRDATLWVGNIPEAEVRGLSSVGAERLLVLLNRYQGVLSISVRRKAAEPGKHKSWALVTFESKEAASLAFNKVHGDVYGMDESGRKVPLVFKRSEVEANMSSIGALAAIFHMHIAQTLESFGKYSVTVLTTLGIGRVFSINVRRTMLMSDLKARICSPTFSKGFRADRATLLLERDGTLLDDKLTVGQANILPGTRLVLESKWQKRAQSPICAHHIGQDF